jgi:WD40 repeat protein
MFALGSLAVSCDGCWLAAGSMSGIINMMHWEDSDSRRSGKAPFITRRAVGAGMATKTVSFSYDSLLLVASAKSIVVHCVESGEKISQCDPDKGRVASLFHSSGKCLVCADSDGISVKAFPF